MKYKVPDNDWFKHLVYYITDAKDGDVIVVDTQSKADAGERVCAKTFPDKHITFEVKEREFTLPE